jgi:hypothetical protein
LPRHTARRLALLEKAGLVDDEDRIVICQMLDDIVAHDIAQGISIPIPATQDCLLPPHGYPDPVGNGLVESLPRPGGNVTGLSRQLTDSTGKRLEVLREFLPGLRRVAILFNAANPLTAPELNTAQAAAANLGLDTVKCDIRRAEDVAPAIEALRGRADALTGVDEAERFGKPWDRTWRPNRCAAGVSFQIGTNRNKPGRNRTVILAIPAGFEPATLGVEIRYSDRWKMCV